MAPKDLDEFSLLLGEMKSDIKNIKEMTVNAKYQSIREVQLDKIMDHARNDIKQIDANTIIMKNRLKEYGYFVTEEAPEEVLEASDFLDNRIEKLRLSEQLIDNCLKEKKALQDDKKAKAAIAKQAGIFAKRASNPPPDKRLEKFKQWQEERRRKQKEEKEERQKREKHM